MEVYRSPFTHFFFIIFTVMCLSERSYCQFNKGKSKGNKGEAYELQSFANSQKDSVRGCEGLQAMAVPLVRVRAKPRGTRQGSGGPERLVITGCKLLSRCAGSPIRCAPFLLVMHSVMSCQV